MADVFYVHWNREEAAVRARELEASGHRLRVHWSTEAGARIDPLPQALVISLDRLPSHGRSIAEWMWEAKKRQHVPIVFAGGKPDKVQAAKERFPRAVFCAPDAVPAALQRALRAAAELTWE